MGVAAEFTIEPFVEGDPGPHVLAGWDAARAAGFEPVMEAFGSTIEGPQGEVLDAVHALLAAAIDAGATRVSLQLRVTP
jgi:uncharacterized protein YqgV (UPF0045/DUF77 family)